MNFPADTGFICTNHLIQIRIFLCRISAANYNDHMHMIWHDYELVDFNPGIMIFNIHYRISSYFSIAADVID